jgi:hypothetical protein
MVFYFIFFLPLFILFYGGVMLADATPGRTEELCYDPYVRRPPSIRELLNAMFSAPVEQ